MKKQTRTGPALTWRIVSLILALWFICMIILTLCVASDMRIQVAQKLEVFVENGSRGYASDDSELPGFAETQMITYLGSPYIWLNLDQLLPIVRDQNFDGSISSSDWMWGKWHFYYGYEPAVIYYDENGAEMIRTGHYLTFDYTTPENWNQRNFDPIGKSYIALDEIPGGAECFEHIISDHATGDVGMGMLYSLFRLTGWFEGNEFHPTMIEDGHYLSHDGWVTDLGQLASRDERGLLEWETMLTCDAPADQTLVTIYAFNPGGYNNTPRPVTVNGKTYDTLADMLASARNSGNTFSYEKNSMLDSIAISARTHVDSYGTFTIWAAVRCNPLQYAALRLIWVYVISLIVILLLLWRLLALIRRNLTAPLEEMAGSARNGYQMFRKSRWREPAILSESITEIHQTLAENKTELTRLRTALDYARDAEENRKALVSNITHELKTPLAIIHTYTECLQEDISPKNREAYLATILDETERMDGIVLQMLELSRLEAGRVRLASENFSLLELAKAIADKLEPLMAERELTLSYGLTQEFMMTGDEGRLEQVITNLLSNALKYTSDNGMIHIQVFESRGTAYFRVENTTPHLSEEALPKVWDPFYRTDTSRNTSGTGLGLALVKSIITLHGGTCSVRNTIMEDGVEGVKFSFEIPI